MPLYFVFQFKKHAAADCLGLFRHFITFRDARLLSCMGYEFTVFTWLSFSIWSLVVMFNLVSVHGSDANNH
jgi:hypothetical protein